VAIGLLWQKQIVSMSPQEVKVTAERLFKARQYPEALPLLKSAAEAFPKDEALWQELVLAASLTGKHDQAVEFATEAIRQHPRSDWLWRQLGSELTSVVRTHFDAVHEQLQAGCAPGAVVSHKQVLPLAALHGFPG
jgi:tetratricopeptide (TPR) repeat protein